MQKENFLWNGGEQLIWSLYDLAAGGCGGVTPCPRSGAEARRTPCLTGAAPGRSYPMSEVRGGSREYQTATAQEQPPHVRVQGCGWKELPHIRGQGWRLRGATTCPRSGGCMGAGRPRGATPRSRSGGAVVRSYPSSKVRSLGCSLLEQPWRYTPHPR